MELHLIFFWDSFTHNHGYFVNHISILRNSISFFNKQIPILKIAQHLSTFTCALIILSTIFKLPKNDTQKTSINKTYWIMILFFTLTIIMLRFLTGLDYKAYGHIIVSLISSVLISLIITPLFLNLKNDC